MKIAGSVIFILIFLVASRCGDADIPDTGRGEVGIYGNKFIWTVTGEAFVLISTLFFIRKTLINLGMALTGVQKR